jgi:hypothetical protein
MLPADRSHRVFGVYFVTVILLLLVFPAASVGAFPTWRCWSCSALSSLDP